MNTHYASHEINLAVKLIYGLSSILHEKLGSPQTREIVVDNYLIVDNKKASVNDSQEKFKQVQIRRERTRVSGQTRGLV